MSKRFSIFLDMMLPNTAWNRRMRTGGPANRIKYWALRLGLVILVRWAPELRQQVKTLSAVR